MFQLWELKSGRWPNWSFSFLLTDPSDQVLCLFPASSLISASYGGIENKDLRQHQCLLKGRTHEGVLRVVKGGIILHNKLGKNLIWDHAVPKAKISVEY